MDTMIDPADPARPSVGESRSILCNGRTIAYFVVGAGYPVLLSASAGRSVSDFNELVIALAEYGFQAIMVEAPGIGGSSLPQSDPTLADLAGDLAAVWEAEARSENPFLIGHAFGNRVVRMFASLYPGSSKGVVLVAAGGRSAVPEDAAQALRSCFDSSLSREDHDRALRHAFFAQGNPVPDYWRRGWYSKTATLQGKAKWGGDDAWLAAGGAPILVLQAEHDRIAPARDAGESLEASFPEQVELVMVPDSGHALLPEQPSLIADRIVRFFKQQL